MTGPGQRPALAEPEAARARLRGRRRDLAARSPAWRLLLRLWPWKRRLARLGPLGQGPALLVRGLEMALVEGIPGVAAVVMRRARELRRSRGPSGVGRPLPRPLTPLVIAPMTDPQGVSIVIAAFNQAALTDRCLRSLVAETPAGHFEVIVVDNASSDDTSRLLASVDGVRVIRNPTNLGFGAACNQAAAAARGAFILFLNNDTIVCPGWLPPMLETLRRDPSIGAVGPKLLYPDGRLQEAGGVIWSDGTGWNYGRRDHPDRPEYGYVREVDYCSAACLLVRRELFARVGGFDPRYAPAYYEDVDFCFEIRRLGFRVVYQPQARVVHVEGATAGTNARAGYKRFQETNRPRLQEKHASALSVQYPPSPDNVFRARDRGADMRILVVDHMVPTPDRDAGSVRMRAILELLVSLGHKVILAPDNLAPVEPYTTALQQLGIEVLHGPLSIAKYIERHLHDLDLIVLCRAPVAIKYMPALAGRSDRPPVIFDTVDLHHLREERRAALEGSSAVARDAGLIRATELFLAAAADLTWVVSAHEVDVLLHEEPGLPVQVMPLIHTVRETVPPASGRRDLLFVGGFRHPPNQDAVTYMVREILPLVAREIPGVRLLVVGSDISPTIERLASASVAILGHARDLDPLLDACRVFVAPLRYGAGLKGKITHSLAGGLPVVTTSIGAEGLQLQGRALIADDPAAFATHVIELYRNDRLWARLSDEGRRHVAAQFGPDVARTRLATTLAGLRKASTRSP